METFDEILGAFEQALELERELGTRTVECDRALLTPLRPAAPAAPKPAPQVETPPKTLQTPVPSRPTSSSPPPSHLSQPSHPSQPSQPSPLVDFAFIAAQIPQGAAAELLAKMVAAMGYTMTQVTVVAAATAVESKPRAKVYVVLGGSDAFRVFAPGQRAALGLWTEVGGVPTIVTYSPAKILSYFGNDVAGLTKAKRQIWSDLKSALARIGRKPPVR
ncbi:MAG: hypothetical protein Q4G65_10480 [bacterium]|nr:hypothetical protein [bacterium]